MEMHLILHGVLSLALIVSCYTDFKSRKILNRVTYSASLFAITLIAISSILGSLGIADVASLHTLPTALAGGIVCFGFMLIIYMHGGCGAGDVKLALVIGTVLGVQLGLNALLWTHLSALCFVATRFAFKVICNVAAKFRSGALLADGTLAPLSDVLRCARHQMKSSIPMAAFFGIGYLMTFTTFRFL